MYFEKLKNSLIIKNSAWGVISIVLQNLLLTFFFSCLARAYSTHDFAQFLIASTLYQFVAAFSTLGMGQWFIREYLSSKHQQALTGQYFKIQLCFGLLFYGVNGLAAYLLYSDPITLTLSLLLGLNVVFDNLIEMIKSLNTANYEQKTTFKILLIEAFLRALIGLCTLLFSLSIGWVAVLMISARLVTLFVFFRLGFSRHASLGTIWSAKVSLSQILSMIGNNKYFIVIGSVSVVYWRSAGIIISKTLAPIDVANYELAFKLFILAQIIPLIFSSTIYPKLIALAGTNNMGSLARFYRNLHAVYFLFGIIAFTFMYSFCGLLIDLIFGESYSGAVEVTRQMFFVILLFPTAFFQANLLVALKKEQADMWINLITLSFYLLLISVGFHFHQSLSIVNYAIFLSWVAFHGLQDIILVRKGLSSFKHCILFYGLTILAVCSYMYLASIMPPFLVFIVFWSVLAGVGLLNRQRFNLTQWVDHIISA